MTPEEIGFTMLADIFNNIEKSGDYALVADAGKLELYKTISDDERAPFMELGYEVTWDGVEWRVKHV